MRASSYYEKNMITGEFAVNGDITRESLDPHSKV